jgi:hypothetical protein
MVNIIEVAFVLSAAAYLVLLIACVVFHFNHIKEQQEIAKLNIRWPAWENRL